jgi:hypothetical protein
MTSRNTSTLVARIQQLAESGDYEGFNAIVGALTDDFDASEIDMIKRDAVFRNRITDVCYEAWHRKHSRRAQ